jgi:hypothetical protein
MDNGTFRRAETTGTCRKRGHCSSRCSCPHRFPPDSLLFPRYFCLRFLVSDWNYQNCRIFMKSRHLCGSSPFVNIVLTNSETLVGLSLGSTFKSALYRQRMSSRRCLEQITNHSKLLSPIILLSIVLQFLNAPIMEGTILEISDLNSHDGFGVGSKG